MLLPSRAGGIVNKGRVRGGLYEGIYREGRTAPYCCLLALER